MKNSILRSSRVQVRATKMRMRAAKMAENLQTFPRRRLLIANFDVCQKSLTKKMQIIKILCQIP